MKPGLRLLSQGETFTGVLPLSAQVRDGATVLDVLKEKHPESQPAHENALLCVQNENPDFHPIAFNQITPEAVRRAVLRTEGAAGPSGVDTLGWRRLCTSFRGASSDLCSSKQHLLGNSPPNG